MPACKLCFFCKNLDSITFNLDSKKTEGCVCLADKFNEGLIIGYYSRANLLKSKDIAEDCDKFKDRFDKTVK
jgi:hypothetical protein